MTNIFVGPEAIQLVVSSFFVVPFEHKFPHKDTNKIYPRKDQRMFFSIPAVRTEKGKSSETTQLKDPPKRFFKFGELYRVIYNQLAVKDLLKSKSNSNLQKILATGIQIHKFDSEAKQWICMSRKSFQDKKLYREDTQPNVFQRIKYVLFPSYTTTH